MNRRMVLTALGSTGVALAGCLRTLEEQVEEAPIAERFDCTEADRPACEVSLDGENEFDTDASHADVEPTGTVEYPQGPVDAEERLTYVESFEEAYATNEYVCSRDQPALITDVEISVEATWEFEWYDSISIFRLNYTKRQEGVTDDGRSWDAGPRYHGAAYAIDDTGVVRNSAPGIDSPTGEPDGERSPDPVSTGILLACFD